MPVYRWAALLVSVAAIGAFASCKKTGATASSSTTGSGNQGGFAGFGGSAVASSTPASATGTGGAAGAGGAGGADGGMLPPCPTTYTTITQTQCSLYLQDCGPGETCLPNENGDAAVCVSCASGLGGPGAPCVVQGDCLAGLICAGQCSPVCCPTTGTPCPGTTCNTQLFYNNAQTLYVYICAYGQTCQPLTANACPSMTYCHIEGGGVATCDSPSGMVVPEGGACQFLNDCGNMQTCDNGVCRYNCFVTGGSGDPLGLGGCPAGQTCNAADTGIPNIGVCAP
jgi:hypothetical protein